METDYKSKLLPGAVGRSISNTFEDGLRRLEKLQCNHPSCRVPNQPARDPIKFPHLLYTEMRDTYEFNHIDPSLPQERIVHLKNLYAYYHKKTSWLREAVSRFPKEKLRLQPFGWQTYYKCCHGRRYFNESNCYRNLNKGWPCPERSRQPKNYNRKAEQANFARIDLFISIYSIPELQR